MSKRADQYLSQIIKKFIYLSICALLVLMPLLRNARYIYATEIVVSGNGEGSQTQVNITQGSSNTVVQSNTSEVQNTDQTTADTGNNSTSANNNEDNTISTGEVNTHSDVSNQMNQSSVNQGCCPNNSTTNIAVSGNGSDSTNTVDVSTVTQNNVNINQIANINNNLSGDLNTGNNNANGNSGGEDSIFTGNILAHVNVTNENINIANIKTAIQNPSVNILINDNAPNSNNHITFTPLLSTILNINNHANIYSPIKFSANTGGNNASGNTDKNTLIVTGSVFLFINVQNKNINLGGIIIDCCLTPSDPSDPPPGPNPTPPLGGVDNGDSDNNNDDTGGEGDDASSGAGAGGGEVLGALTGHMLPATGGNTLLHTTLLLIEILLLGIFLKINSKYLSQKTSLLKNSLITNSLIAKQEVLIRLTQHSFSGV